MNLLRIALLCAAIVGPTGVETVRADDQPPPSNGQTVTQPSPPVHCEGQNCLPPKDDPALECKGQDCTPAPATDQPTGPEIKPAEPEIEKVK